MIFKKISRYIIDWFKDGWPIIEFRKHTKGVNENW